MKKEWLQKLGMVSRDISGNTIGNGSVIGSKGGLISVDGKLRTRKCEKACSNHYVTEILVNTFQLLESRAQRSMRENNTGDDRADLVLEEEELSF